MGAKNSLILSDEFLEFCKLNDIEDIQAYAKEVFNIGFNFKKYGTKPGGKKVPPPPPPPPPARKIVEGKKPETHEEYKKRYDKIQEEHKKLYDE